MTKAEVELTKVKELFHKLREAQEVTFPPARTPLIAPDKRGVYVIYNPLGRVVHVGRTPSGQRGIKQRLQNHLYGISSFAENYPPLEGDGSKLRCRYKFRCLPVEDGRIRALLEAYAIGCLCPDYLGLSEPVIKS